MYSKTSTEAKTEQWVSEFWNKNFAYSDIKEKNSITFNTFLTKVFWDYLFVILVLAMYAGILSVLWEFTFALKVKCTYSLEKVGVFFRTVT